MDTIGAIRAALLTYWNEAVAPLHRMGWQTLSLFALIVLLVALIATFLFSISWAWPWAKKAIAGAAVKPGPHTYKDHLRLSTADYIKFHKLSDTAGRAAQSVTNVRSRDLDRYYVVTIVEREKRKVVVYRELKLQCPMGGKYQTSTNEIQLDEALLTQVRFENGNVDDDEPGTQIAGTYDVYIRPVRWYDVRHWLQHPNREIRIVIWVTIITTTLPVVLDLLFG